jgi:hypothetical protein
MNKLNESIEALSQDIGQKKEALIKEALCNALGKDHVAMEEVQGRVRLEIDESTAMETYLLDDQPILFMTFSQITSGSFESPMRWGFKYHVVPPREPSDSSPCSSHSEQSNPATVQ